MSNRKSALSEEVPSQAIVNGHTVSSKKPTGIKKLLNLRYGPQLLVVLMFAIIGTSGVLFASATTTKSSLWSSEDKPTTVIDSDTKSVELGVKFQSKYSGTVTGVKFYKSSQNTGTHTGTLWDSEGNKLATVTFANETASGWQTANFPQAVNIAANVNYIISYHAPNGHYSGDQNYFNQARVNGPLTAPKSEAGKPNGVYVYSGSTTFPTETYQASNYWVDVVFETELITPPVASAPPTSVSAAIEGNAIRVSWNKGTSSTPITKYRIYKNGVYLRAVGPSPLNYLDTDVVPGKTYKYQIKTVDVYGVGSIRSVPATITFNVTPPPTCPSGQTGTPPNCVTPPITPPTTPPTGSVPCDLKPEAASCWATHTGVPGYSEAQIVAGKSNLRHVISQATAPAGTTYANGNLTVTSPGTIIDRIWLDGCIAIKANNVTIKSSLIRTSTACYGGNGQAAGSAINTGGSGSTSGLVIQDTEVNGMDANYDFTGIGAQSYTCTRCNVHGAVKNLWAGSNVTIRDSYVHHPSTRNGTIHGEPIMADSGNNVTIDHSWVSAKGTGYMTGAVQFLASWGPGNDLTINNSFLEGGDGADFATDSRAYNIRITNNAFSNDNGYGGTTFVYGFNRANPGMVWTGNYIPQTGAVLPMPANP